MARSGWMAAHPPIEISVAHHGEWTVAHVRGDLDMGTTPELESRVASVDGSLALHLANVEFIDSMGLRGLIRCRDARQRLVIVAPSAVVTRLLALTGLTGSFDVVADLDDLDAAG